MHIKTLNEAIDKILNENNDLLTLVKSALSKNKDVNLKDIIIPYKDEPLRVRIPYKSYFKDDYMGKDERSQLSVLKNIKGFTPVSFINVRLGKVDGFEVIFKKKTNESLNDIAIDGGKYVDQFAILKIDYKDIITFIDDNNKVSEIEKFLKTSKRKPTQYNKEGGQPAELWVYSGKSVKYEISYKNNKWQLNKPTTGGSKVFETPSEPKTLKDALQYVIKR